jgi:hypothetical protein
MCGMKHLFGIKAASRPMSFALLICVLMFQFIAPAVSASAPVQPSQKQAPITDHARHTAMQHAAPENMDHGGSETGGHHEDASQCPPSMCCFHELSTPFDLIAIGVLVPVSRVLDAATALPSYSRSTKDRPPQLL